MPVVAIGVIKPLAHSRCLGIGVNGAEGIESPPVVFWGDRGGVIARLPEVPAPPCKAVEQHGGVPPHPVHQFGQLAGIIGLDQ